MCAGGPPKPMQPIRPHSRTTVASLGAADRREAFEGIGRAGPFRARPSGMRQPERLDRRRPTGRHIAVDHHSFEPDTAFSRP
jgi:hypothetical protein